MKNEAHFVCIYTYIYIYNPINKYAKINKLIQAFYLYYFLL